MSFDRLAPFYSTLERIVFGDALQQARIACIPHLDESARVLVIGEGDGRFLRALYAAKPDCEITCIDASASMIERARRRLRRSSLPTSARVEFVHGDILAIPLRGPFHAIVTNFVLDCFDERELPAIIDKLASCAAPKAKLIVSDFHAPQAGASRIFARLLIATMYRFFRCTAGISASRLVNYSPLLTGHGFQCTARHRFYRGIVRSELWQRI